MLSEVKVSSCIDGLVRLGILERQGERGGDELLGLKAMPKGVIGRVAGGEFGEPPEGVELLPWFSCILLKIHLEEKDVTVSNVGRGCETRIICRVRSSRPEPPKEPQITEKGTDVAVHYPMRASIRSSDSKTSSPCRVHRWDNAWMSSFGVASSGYRNAGLDSVQPLVNQALKKTMHACLESLVDHGLEW